MDIERQNFLKECEEQNQSALVKKIIERKKQGVDCTEQESAEIKMFVKETIILAGSGDAQIIEDIQLLFPLEYGEAIDEMEA